MTLIEAIQQRHSVRTYQGKPIEKDIVEKLVAYIDECNKEGNVRFVFCENAGNTFNRLLNKAMGLGSAPSVISCMGPDDDTLDERIGYYGEKIVLYAQQLGLNTCWAGTFNAKNMPAQPKAGERLVISIAIGYGVDNGRVRKSKTADQVSIANGNKPEWFNCGVEMALLAPTAINQQKFEIVLNEDETVSFNDKGGVLSKVDLGIVRCHFEIGADYAKNK